MSVSQFGFQKQPDWLQEAREERNLEVNCDKTKIIIFRKKVTASKNVKGGSYMIRNQRLLIATGARAFCLLPH